MESVSGRDWTEDETRVAFLSECLGVPQGIRDTARHVVTTVRLIKHGDFGVDSIINGVNTCARKFKSGVYHTDSLRFSHKTGSLLNDYRNSPERFLTESYNALARLSEILMSQNCVESRR